ncbi:MAG: hypothetical protein QOE24_730 [Frankiales bacterium]|nr:hypothetical protein [Frankiales bacterium]
MSGQLTGPLSTGLSQLLVAFTIECDNEFEHRMPHRTAADRGAGNGPWLVSMAMWVNYLRLIPAEGLPLRELTGPYGVPKMSGLQRWGYLVVEPDPDDRRPVPPPGDWLVSPTQAGRRAQEVWRPLAGEVERRWRARFGSGVHDELRDALLALGTRLDPDFAHYPPMLGQGLFANTATPPPGPVGETPDLSVLMSRVLVAFTAEFEARSPVSLALYADVLRILDTDGVRLGDLPRLGGVSKEAVAMAVGWLGSAGQASVGPDPAGGKAKLVSLTSKGSRAQAEAHRLLGDLEAEWTQRFGDDLGRILTAVAAVRAQPSALADGLRPRPEGWRSSRPYLWQTTARLEDPLGTLPHHPMVLHRGGFPDGS